jgi:hypothetical protein
LIFWYAFVKPSKEYVSVVIVPLEEVPITLSFKEVFIALIIFKSSETLKLQALEPEVKS